MKELTLEYLYKQNKYKNNNNKKNKKQKMNN